MSANLDPAELAKFHKLCAVSVIVEADGSNPVICVTANVRDNSTGEYREFKRCIALNPIMRMIADKIKQYHDNLHMQVSGETSWRGLEHENYHARDNHFLSAPEYLENSGLPHGVDPLQVQGWFDKIKKVARSVGEVKAVKSLYSDLKTYGNKAATYAKKGAQYAAKHKDALALAASTIPGGSAAIQTGFKVYDAVSAARKKNPEALAALRKIGALAANGDIKAAEAMKAASLMNNMLKAKESGTHVSGWLYNQPYRTNLQVVADGLQGKFPTVGMAMRQGWHDGLEFVGTMKRKNYGPSLGI